MGRGRETSYIDYVNKTSIASDNSTAHDRFTPHILSKAVYYSDARRFSQYDIINRLVFILYLSYREGT